ncbi:unnamed protein product [Meganyctiphanes norvegica]|uniref:Uncharacterized protein n=1 Tax=Meganyctiphanes norvegica TaxID=48144 RepID=A0AAV2R241_MEGNR
MTHQLTDFDLERMEEILADPNADITPFMEYLEQDDEASTKKQNFSNNSNTEQQGLVSETAHQDTQLVDNNQQQRLLESVDDSTIENMYLLAVQNVENQNNDFITMLLNNGVLIEGQVGAAFELPYLLDEQGIVPVFSHNNLGLFEENSNLSMVYPN